MKKLIAITSLALLTMSVLVAQPPSPPGASGNSGESPTQSNSINRQGPVGTATLLMLGLGGVVLGAKLKRNRQDGE